MHNQSFLNNYFTNNWRSSISKYIYSGYAILNKISDSDSVIDIGCGTNPFKGKIKNLIGIDPTHVGADIINTIENFESSTQFDVALCLGSINFGTDEIISNQINKVNSLLKPTAKVFWRLNPGRHDHPDKLCEYVDFYPWTFEKLNEYAKEYGFTQINCAKDTDGIVVRLYAEWVKVDPLVDE